MIDTVHQKKIWREDLQLVSLTCLYIASKYIDVSAIEVEDILYISNNNNLSVDNVQEMEVNILTTLGYKLSYHSVIEYVNYFEKLLEISNNTMLFCIEYLSYLCYFFPDLSMKYTSCRLTCACLLIAFMFLLLWDRNTEVDILDDIEELQSQVSDFAGVIFKITGGNNNNGFNEDDYLQIVDIFIDLLSDDKLKTGVIYKNYNVIEKDKVSLKITMSLSDMRIMFDMLYPTFGQIVECNYIPPESFGTKVRGNIWREKNKRPEIEKLTFED